MHGWGEQAESLLLAIEDYVRDRLRMDPPTLDGPIEPADLAARAGRTITTDGIGEQAALRVFGEVLAPATISTDHPRNLAFIPSAATEASLLFDLVVAASSIYGGSWLEGAGAVHAENEVLAWLAGLSRYPESAGGVVVPGGTQGNLAALVTARQWARHQRAERGLPEPRRWVIATSEESHSSIWHVARVMDVDVLSVEVPAEGAGAGRLTGPLLEAAVRERLPHTDEVFAVAAAGGTTNYGIVDALDSIADVTQRNGWWLHVDGAYGGAGLLCPELWEVFAGIERSDSWIVDPHKWLFAPYDACALIYREPRLARAAHVQHASYLEVLNESPHFNPSDYAVHLSRRARGLPLWFSVAVHGTDAYTAAVRQTMAVTAYAADAVRARPHLALIREPMLSVVVFERVGWEQADYDAWSQGLLAAGTAFVTPTRHRGRTVTRLAIVNPRTTPADIDTVLDSLPACG